MSKILFRIVLCQYSILFVRNELVNVKQFGTGFGQWQVLRIFQLLIALLNIDSFPYMKVQISIRMYFKRVVYYICRMIFYFAFFYLPRVLNISYLYVKCLHRFLKSFLSQYILEVCLFFMEQFQLYEFIIQICFNSNQYIYV